MDDVVGAPQALVKRRNYFVKKRLQSRYAAYFLAILVASSGALMFLLEHRARLVLRTEMYKGHSSVLDTWSILRPEMARTTFAVVAIVIVAAALVTLAVTWAAHRASTTVTANLRSFCAGAQRKSWAAVGHPRELAHLQDLLADALESHEFRIAQMHSKVDVLLSQTRALRAPGAEAPDGRERTLLLRKDFLESAHAFEHFGKEG